MTFKDYDFLISTMEKIVSLDITSSNLNEQKEKMISETTCFEDEINSITSTIEELKKGKPTIEEPDSIGKIIGEKEVLLSKNILERKELKRKISKLDGKTRSITGALTGSEEWKDSNWGHYSNVDVIGHSLFISAFVFIPIFVGFIYAAVLFPGVIPDLADDCTAQEKEDYKGFSTIDCETMDDTIFTSVVCMVPVTLGFILFIRSIKNTDKKNMPILLNLENERNELNSILEKEMKLTRLLKREIRVLSNTKESHDTFEKNRNEQEGKLGPLKDSLGLRLGGIEAIESEIAIINDEIVNLLESVSHLTPYNSEL